MALLTSEQRNEVRHQTAWLGLEHGMGIANAYLGGHGVEYAAHVDDTPSTRYGFTYVNMGDPYRPTVLYDHKFETFHWEMPWGNLVEAREGEYL